MTWTVAIILLGVLIVDFALRCLAARLILPMFERKPPFGRPPQVCLDTEEIVSFPTTNGLLLRGRIHRQTQGPPRGVIIFCPEMEGDSTSALYYCEALFKAGFDLFAFDFRNQGESESLKGYEPLHWLTEFEVEDAIAAIEYVRSREDWADLPLGMVGISRGGGAALSAASRRGDVERVVVEGAFTTHQLMEYYTLRWAELYIPQWLMNLFPLWHVRGTLAMVRFLSQLRRRCRYVRLDREIARLDGTPVLMIHGERDSYVPLETARQLARRLPENNELWLVPKTNHNKAKETHPQEYDQQLTSFFDAMDDPQAAGQAEHSLPQPA